MEEKREKKQGGVTSVEWGVIAYTFERGPGLRLLRVGDTLADIIAFGDGSVLILGEDGYFD